MLNLAKKHNQPSLDMRNLEGSTLLHVAAIVGNTNSAKMLVERNQDLLYEKDNEDQTPDDLFDSTVIVINAISSKDYDSAYEMRSVKDPDNVLTAIAQNFPPKVKFLGSMSLQSGLIDQGRLSSPIEIQLIEEDELDKRNWILID
ncbi:hypothetical protein E3N88_09602 [Mikania micrantha]|uniref:Uncharacterized protein n=1 Tax=Mikania micrantha TaxID=192012 RepID=A0A5N6PLR8_9ASTR|nr:hypothetical protein E3N88_09602 [Mikania micrantha]